MNNNIPPERRQPPKRTQAERIKREREIRRARIELALIALAALVVIILIVIVIAGIVRTFSSSPSDSPKDTAPRPAVTDIAPSDDTSDAEAEEPGIMSYAEITDDTRYLSSEISSKNAIMIDLAENKVLFTKGGDERIYPASMTKILTLIVACEHAGNLDDTFEMTEEIVGKLYLENATVAGFLPGEKVRFDYLVYGLILPSGADSAVALAIKTAGSEEKFADMMNETAKKLGLKNSHFTNPTGLHDSAQYSTCHDMALILEYALRDDFMRTVLSTYTYKTHATAEHPEGIELYSTMLGRMYGDEAPGMFILGGKTGYTNEAKNCLASFAVRYDEERESEEDAYKKSPEYIFVSASSSGKYGPVYDAINAYALVLDKNALDTRQGPPVG